MDLNFHLFLTPSNPLDLEEILEIEQDIWATFMVVLGVLTDACPKRPT